MYNAKHLCRECGQRYELHAGPRNAYAPDERCPGPDAKYPKTVRDETRALALFDARLRRMWTARSTTFRPV